MTPPILLATAAYLPMIGEAVLSGRHDRALRAAGAREPAGDVYQWMQVAYPACFGAICLEAWLRDRPVAQAAAAGWAIFAAAKGLKYWAIASLGRRWTFRVLVPPGSQPTGRGPYRWLRHPNYLAVGGELLGLAVAGGALVTGPLALAGFGALIARRVRVEERALGISR